MPLKHSSQQDYPIERVMAVLEAVYPYHPMRDITEGDPYKVLVCALLSVRSRDVVTMPVCGRLFEKAATPQEMLDLPPEELQALIARVSFAPGKVKTLRDVSAELLNRFDGKVPADIDTLTTLHGVGRKTANLVMTMGFDHPAIAVDTHVHRICNRLGYVQTKSPDATEKALREKLPTRYWGVINRVMVRHGQEICVWRYPKCDICPVRDYCAQVDVTPRKDRAQQGPVNAVFRPGG